MIRYATLLRVLSAVEYLEFASYRFTMLDNALMMRDVIISWNIALSLEREREEVMNVESVKSEHR